MRGALIMAVALSSCVPFRVLPVHHPAQLRRAPPGSDAAPSVEGWSVVLELVRDDALAPVGARFDSGRSHVDQTLVLPEPGLVAFEAIGRALEEGGARVQRAYGARLGRPTTGSTEVLLSVDHVELHHFRYTRRGTPVDAIAARVDLVAYVDGDPHTLSASRQVPATDDVFAAVGRALAAQLAEVRP